MKKSEAREKLEEIIRENKRKNKFKADVARDWKSRLADYEQPAGWYEDLMQGGCASGFVGKLIYTTDAQKYYDKHYEDIESLIADVEAGTGEKVDNYNKSGIDIKNFRAWLAYEEMAQAIAAEIGIEI